MPINVEAGSTSSYDQHTRKIIWGFERPTVEAPNNAVHHEDQYIPLQISEVKDRAENIPEEALRTYLEAIPQFSKQKSTIFAGLDQTKAMEYDYIFIKDSLKILEKEAHELHSKFTTTSDFNKLSRNLQDLKDFSKLLTQGTTERLYTLKHQGSHIISKMVWDGQIERLNAILHDLNSLKDDEEERRFSAVNILIYKLQRNIFQTVDYMYKQQIISANALKEFFQLKNTLELAALNMYYTTEKERVADFFYELDRNENPISTLHKWDCANYRTLYEVLDEREKRYFSYLSLRTFKIYFETSKSTFYDSLFEDDHLFHTLEECFSKFSKFSLSKATKESNNGEINQYSQIGNKEQALIHIFEALIKIFKNSESERSKTIAFFILDFIQSNYDLEILDFQKGELFQEKMNSMSSRFQLMAELQNIKWYMAKKASSESTLTDDRKSLGGEVVMIYKYYFLLIPKIQQILSHDELGNYVQNFKLHGEKFDVESIIEEIMSVTKYYSVK
ncbi:hypothetical protein VP01_807g7 [Puccinia sorghi]|uniref:Uncharacterized protein n=1 Tax=Puccinia sorghi TaxID=27349 RepID=A0A0L6UB60_9BASI|nr:hypothetical protein VP01_807g7 [Puccinia sorghi]